MSIEEIEREIRAAIEAQIKLGKQCVRGSMVGLGGCDCALGLYVDQSGSREYFGWSYAQISAFVDAFDNEERAREFTKMYPEIAALGRRLAADYVK